MGRPGPSVVPFWPTPPPAYYGPLSLSHWGIPRQNIFPQLAQLMKDEPPTPGVGADSTPALAAVDGGGGGPQLQAEVGTTSTYDGCYGVSIMVLSADCRC